MSVFQSLIDVYNNRGACYVILIDPDNKNDDLILSQVEMANRSEVDAIFVGGSLMMDGKSHNRLKKIKQIANIPVILFPGGVNQINSNYDAMLFLSLLSGRNPHYLIGEQVISAPIVRDIGLEAISTGYILLDGGNVSSVEFMSGTRPIPMDKKDIIASHALAGQYLGMKSIYLEAGSGAKNYIPSDIVELVSNFVSIPIIVGGGISSPKIAAKLVKAGAWIIVTGTAIEKNHSSMSDFASAVHWKG